MIAAKDWGEDAKGIQLPCRLVVKWDGLGHWAVEGEQGDTLAAGMVGPSEDTEFDAKVHALAAAKYVLDKSVKVMLATATTIYEHRLLTVPAVDPGRGGQ